MTDETRELVQSATLGDDNAIEALLQRYLPALERYVGRHAAGAVLAKESRSDLAQSVCREVLVRLRHGRFDFLGEAQFRQWLYRAAVMKLMNRHRFYEAERRDVRREAKPSSQVPPTPANQHSPSEHAVLQEDMARFEHAFAELPENYREVLELHHVEGLAHAQIAERLGITEPHSRVLLSRALARLASVL